MQFPDLTLEKEKPAAAFSREYEVPLKEIRDAYLKSHPDAASQAAVYLARSADGARFL